MTSVAILTCWPDDVSVGSGTAVGQRSLRDALSSAGFDVAALRTSRFATSWPGLAARRIAASRRPNLRPFAAVLGIDGEGWRYASKLGGRYVAVTKAVLADVLRYEPQRLGPLTIQADWERKSAERAAVVIAASAYAAERVRALYRIPAARIRVIPEAFDFAAWRAMLPRAERGPIVLAVGHLYRRKNYAALLEAWPLVRAARPDARLVIVGDGPERERLRPLASATPGMRLAGHIPRAELLALYAGATVFAHPSLQENFGISPLEAVASGLRVVAYAQEAVAENLAGLDGVHLTADLSPARLALLIVDALAAGTVAPARHEALAARLAPAAVGRRWRVLIDGLARSG